MAEHIPPRMADMPSAIESSTKSGIQNAQNQIRFVTASKYRGRSRTDPLIKRRRAKRVPAQKECGAEGSTKDIDWMKITGILQPTIPAGYALLVHGAYCKDRVFRMISKPLIDLLQQARGVPTVVVRESNDLTGSS
jgi:hypothetical protein